ncbi:TPA: tRNA 2-thiouridine(34) synthase MnmA [Candidatus Berkelbacteria bacterium]|uniref:tRNA-specific 2-thiouridylase MnmA n=1 Tax=Berkelbacteria bacterium GW2011_GWE1_39_12 TaxID=1618337 RepID=A0A0G4B3P1_9BACT|nr:MAG: tRNA-specific 2-thiouridylase MnmA, tRNA-specific 2-thiouridylase [Berkelbacteria bacterium GW2011_GWE1_39_12]HBO60571.1 tRNA 2-thiouridine(34) synthase MnmA [Candidatus Berkelbacteria bacterium]
MKNKQSLFSNKNKGTLFSDEKKKRVIVAMSGGVDSSVAAALLKNQGYEVIGIFMKFWTEDNDKTDLVRENICCSLDAATAARAVAQKLGIPFYVVNFANEFKKAVVDYYIKEYEEGRTPNPCVICNRDIKGEVLLKKVLDLGGDYLATGHYAQIKRKGGICHFYQGSDEKKDQSYFLWTLTQEKLAKMLFPVGNLAKPEVRDLARKMNLPTAERRESQGICFIPDRNVADFLRRHGKKLAKSGPILDKEGNVLGQHDGLINYTIGQREHLGLGGPDAYYVLELDSRKNALVVGEDVDLFHKNLIVEDVNWISPEFAKKEKAEVGGRIRYGHPIEDCVTIKVGSEYQVSFVKPQRAITPGQSIVFYHKHEMVGGGIIKKINNQKD